MRQRTKPVILLAHGDPWKRYDLASKLNTRSTGSLQIVPVANLAEAESVITNLGEDPARSLMAIIAEPGDGEGQNVLDSITQRYGSTIGVRLTDRNITDSRYVSLSMSAKTLDPKLQELFDCWSPPDPEVQVTGPRDTPKARRLRNLLYINSIDYEWESNQDSEIHIRIGEDAHLIDPELGRLYEELCILPKSKLDPSFPYDLVIVGSGPAGMSAALNADTVGLRTLVVEAAVAGGAAATSINRIENYLGFPGGIHGNKLTRLALDQIRENSTSGIDWHPYYQANQLKKGSRGRHLVKIEDGVEVSAAVIILACGQEPRALNIPTEQKFIDRGIHHIALRSDQEAELGKNVVIVGGGDTAGQASLLFMEGGASVTVVSLDMLRLHMNTRLAGKMIAAAGRNSIKIREKNVVREFIGDQSGQLGGVIIQDLKSEALETIEAESAYVLIGGNPATKWLYSSRIELASDKRVLTDAHLPSNGGSPRLPFETSRPGVFAIGDVRINSLRRVGQAVGQGAAVIASVQDYLRLHGHRVLGGSGSPVAQMFGP